MINDIILAIANFNNYLILDGPRGSLRRLRSQLAEDGCPESQVVLAKQLLEERCGNSFHLHLSIYKGLQDVTGLGKLIVYT